MKGARPASVEHLLPVGCRFAPTEQELLGHYLNNWVTGKPLSLVDAIVEADVYSTEPWNLVDQNEEIAYFFSHRTRQHKNSSYKCRRAGSGTWYSEKKKFPIMDDDNDQVVGYNQIFSFRLVKQQEDKKRKKSTGWVMYEYELPTAEGDSHQNVEPVLCLIKRSAQVISSCRKRIHREVSTGRSPPRYDYDYDYEGCHKQMQAPTWTSSVAELAPVPTWTSSSAAELAPVPTWTSSAAELAPVPTWTSSAAELAPVPTWTSSAAELAPVPSTCTMKDTIGVFPVAQQSETSSYMKALASTSQTPACDSSALIPFDCEDWNPPALMDMQVGDISTADVPSDYPSAYDHSEAVAVDTPLDYPFAWDREAVDFQEFLNTTLLWDKEDDNANLLFADAAIDGCQSIWNPTSTVATAEINNASSSSIIMQIDHRSDPFEQYHFPT